MGARNSEFQPHGQTLKQTHPAEGLGTEHLGFPTGGGELHVLLAAVGGRRCGSG